MNQRTLGQRLRQVRRAREISQTEMARHLGYKSAGPISRIESGDQKLSAVQLHTWATVCGTTTDQILNGSEITVPLGGEVA